MTFNSDEFLRNAIETASHDGVAKMRTLLVETLEKEGFDPVTDDEGNVTVSRTNETPRGFHLVMNTHIDTVPPFVPYKREGDIVRGRGACDAKGPLAAMLEAFCSAAIGDGTLTLAVSPNEETSQRGGAYLGKTVNADGYIVGEPTGLDVCIAARGNFGGRVTICGETAHASTPAQGHNPLRAVGDLIEALEQYDEQHGPAPHELLGTASLAPTRIESGGPLNQIPADCTISFDRRTVPPESIDGFLASLESYLDQRLSDEYDFEVTSAYPDSPDPEAFATDPDTELVLTLAEESGGDIRAFEAATESSYFAASAPTVIFGPGVLADSEGPVAHAKREYVSRTAVTDAAEILRKTIERVL